MITCTHTHSTARCSSDVRLLLDAEQAIIAEERNAALLMLQRAFAATQGAMQAHTLGRYLQTLADMQVRPQPLSFYLQQVRTQLSYDNKTLAEVITERLQGQFGIGAR